MRYLPPPVAFYWQWDCLFEFKPAYSVRRFFSLRKLAEVKKEVLMRTLVR